EVEIVAHTRHAGQGADQALLPPASAPTANEGVSPGVPAVAAMALPAAAADPLAALRPPPAELHDVTVRRRRSYQCARVEGVPPEEFGIARHARSIGDADYCFHDVLRSEARLIAQGYDREQVKRLPSSVIADTI